jgi:hypothetical protein
LGLWNYNIRGVRITPMNQEWLSDYALLKDAVKRRRMTGLSLTGEDMRFFTLSCNSIDAKLKILASAPQSNGLVSSEIARRQVLVDALRKTLETISKEAFLPGGDVKTDAGGEEGGDPELTPTPVRVNSYDDIVGDSGGGALFGGGPGYSKLRTTERGLGQRLMEMTSLQDSLFDDIGQGVARLAQQVS